MKRVNLLAKTHTDCFERIYALAEFFDMIEVELYKDHWYTGDLELAFDCNLR